MNTKQIEAYRYYKNLYPRAIVVFHIDDSFVISSEDVQTIANSNVTLPHNAEKELVIPDNNLEVISTIGDKFPVHIVNYRNDECVLDFPDIERLKQEQDEDY